MPSLRKGSSVFAMAVAIAGCSGGEARTGLTVRVLGRQGSGPGELEGLHRIAWVTNDTLVAMGPGNARLMLLTRQGEQAGQWPWLRLSGFRAGPLQGSVPLPKDLDRSVPPFVRDRFLHVVTRDSMETQQVRTFWIIREGVSTSR